MFQEEKMTLGRKLRQLREGMTLTQRDLAKLIGKDVNQICNWENDKVKPSLHSIRALAYALEVDSRELISLIRE